MKQKIKKIISSLIISILLISNSYAYSSYPDYNNIKIKKLQKLNIQLNDYVNKNIKKAIIGIKNIDVKKDFNSELSLMNEINKDADSFLYYAHDNEFDEGLSRIKSQARTFMRIKKDLLNYTSNGVNVYDINVGDKASTEKNLVDMQTYYTDIIKKSLDSIDFQKDVKQTGDGKFEIISNMGKIGFSIDKYTSIYSILTGNQEADYNITINFDIKKDETLSIPFDINGSLNFKINAKIVDKEIYFTLNDYSFDLSKIKDTSILKLFTTYQTILDPYKGKTIHIPAQTGSGQLKFDYSSQLANIKSVIDILSKKSLLTPYKKEGNGFLLAPNKDTLNELMKIYGGEFTDYQYMEIKKVLNSYPLLYTDNSGSTKITSSVNDKGNQYSLTIEKKGVDYAIELTSKKTTYGEEIQLYLYLQKDIYKLNVISKNITFKFNLENKIFDLLFDMPKFNMTIKGNSDDSNSDLKISINSQDIGTIKSSKDDKGNYTYNLHIKITDFSKIYPEISTELKDKFLEINLSGKYLIEKGEFKIEKPASFIELEDITTPIYSTSIKKARDITRINDIKLLQSGIEQYYQDKIEYPQKIVDVKDYVVRIPVDPNDGQTINGCTFGYKYEVRTDKNGISNGAYTLSTCFEDQENIDKKAKTDGGKDSLRYELGFDF